MMTKWRPARIYEDSVEYFEVTREYYDRHGNILSEELDLSGARYDTLEEAQKRADTLNFYNKEIQKFKKQPKIFRKEG